MKTPIHPIGVIAIDFSRLPRTEAEAKQFIRHQNEASRLRRETEEQERAERRREIESSGALIRSYGPFDKSGQAAGRRTPAPAVAAATPAHTPRPTLASEIYALRQGRL